MKPDPLPENIVLIGFMGSGKSSVGQRVARRRVFSFVDTDRLIEKATDMPISRIFQEFGEKFFRDKETEALESLRGGHDLVVATGGGIVLRPHNVALMRELGCVVWLTAREDVLFERVARNNRRPLLQTPNPRQTLAELLGKRAPLYEAAAHVSVDTSDLSHEEIASRVIAEANRFFAT